MLQVEITDADGTQRLVQVPEDCVIGKGSQNEIRLDSWRLGKEHARLFRTPAGIYVEDMGSFVGVFVNGVRVEAQQGPLNGADIIGIGSFKLRVAELGSVTGVVQAASPGSRSNSAAYRNQLATEEIQASRDFAERRQDEVRRAQAELMADPSSARGASSAPPTNGFALVLAPDPRRKELEFEWRKKVHAALLETMDLRRHDVSSMSDAHLRSETSALIRQILMEQDSAIPRSLDRDLLCKQVLDEAVGLGPLEELLDDESVTEIMVNRFDEIYVERAGRLYKHPLTFTGDRAVLGVIERIVAPLGRRIDESSPMVDARLKDGSRVNAIIAPLALKGPALTIRKFSKRKLSAQDLVGFGAISPAMATFLEICVAARKNIIVSGGTGSGKTTLLNILSNFIPAHERVITVEMLPNLNCITNTWLAWNHGHRMSKAKELFTSVTS